MNDFLIYFPNLIIAEDGENVNLFNGFSLHKIIEFENYNDFFDTNIYCNVANVGCLLKFNDSFLFTTDNLKKINDTVHKIIFCFYSNFHGFSHLRTNVSKETFNFYVFQKINSDKSFEHKIEKTNGIKIFLDSRDKFIKYNNLYVEKLKINSSLFKNMNDLLYDKFITEIENFNNIFCIRSLQDDNINSLFIKVSLEMSINSDENKNLKIKNKYATSDEILLFLDLIDNYIENSEIKNDNIYLYNLYKEIQKYKRFIRDNTLTKLENLREIRNSIAHSGIKDHPFNNTSFFILFFELFMESISYKSIKMEYVEKMIMFLWLMCFEFKIWFSKDLINNANQMNLIELHNDYFRKNLNYKVLYIHVRKRELYKINSMQQ